MLKFFKKVLWCLAWPWMAMVCGFELLSCKTVAKRYEKDPTCLEPEERYHKVNKLVKHILYWKNIQIAYRGKTKLENKPMLFVANHKSNADALVILKTVLEQKVPNICFVAKIELAASKIAPILNLIDTIYIDRENLRQAVSSINEQAEALQKEKMSVGIFPEGTRIEGNEFGEFKAGALGAAYKTYASIQPVVLYNSEGLLEKDKSKQRKKDRVVDISYMPTIQPNEYMNVDKVIYAKRLQDKMYQEYLRLEKHHKDPIDNPKFEK